MSSYLGMVDISIIKRLFRVMSCTSILLFRVMSCTLILLFRVMSCTSIPLFRVMSCTLILLFRVMSCTLILLFRVMSCTSIRLFRVMSCTSILLLSFLLPCKSNMMDTVCNRNDKHTQHTSLLYSNTRPPAQTTHKRPNYPLHCRWVSMSSG